jgi:hypothetical protein
LRNQKKLDEAIAALPQGDPDQSTISVALAKSRLGQVPRGKQADQHRDPGEILQAATWGTGNCGQWIVLALAHGQLARQDGLPEEERARHSTAARHWYEKAVKQIDGNSDQYAILPVIREFRAEAAKLLDGKE